MLKFSLPELELKKENFEDDHATFFGPTAPKESERTLESRSVSVSLSVCLSVCLRPLVFLENRTLEFSNFLYVN